MAISAITGFPFRFSPLNNVQPFTYGTAVSHMAMLEKLRVYINDSLRLEFNDELERMYQAIVDGIANAETVVEGKHTEWLTLFAEFMAAVNANIHELNKELFQAITSPMTYGAVGDGANLDTAAIQLAVDATPDGGSLVFPDEYTFALGTGVIEIQSPIHLVGGTFLTDTGRAFRISHSGASIDGATIAGPGTAVPYVNGNPAIEVEGLPGEYLDGVEIRNCIMFGMRDTGIRTEFVENFRIIKNTVDGFRYGGIMVNSSRNGLVDDNTIMHAVQDTVGLSYGIAVSDLVNTVAGRSENVTVSNNHVEDIPDWEGLDTHGGKNIRFLDNTIVDCRTGISMTVGSDSRVTAPIECRATGNHISAPNLILVKQCTGIGLGGSSPTNAQVLKADAIVSDNTYVGLTTNLALPTSTGGNVDLKKSMLDTGWVDATKYGHFNVGYESNSTYPVKMRVQNGTVKFEGVVSLGVEARASTVFFILDRIELIPAFDRIMGAGSGVAAPFESFILSVNTAGSYRTVFPNTIPTTNFTVSGEYQL